MRILGTVTALLLCACGAPSINDDLDAGPCPPYDAGVVDAGPVDAGPPPWSCKPNEAFCEGSAIWTCTRSGFDALKGNDCATVKAGDFCAKGSCPAGATFVSGSGAFSCCRP